MSFGKLSQNVVETLCQTTYKHTRAMKFVSFPVAEGAWVEF